MEANKSEQVKSKKRVADHGEVFTAEREVNAMLDLVKQETERIDSRFLEPACGNGNFLAEVLRRKLAVVGNRYAESQLEWERYVVLAVSSIYGIEILQDNVAECRERLFVLFNDEYTRLYKNDCKEECRRSVKYLLCRNILWGDALNLKTPNENAEPIVFSEWSAVNGNMLKRRDFTLANLLQGDLHAFNERNKQAGMFSLFSDEGDPAFLPTPVGDFPLIHFLKLGEDDTSEL
jgi:SAM-dependent methyltransferase